MSFFARKPLAPLEYTKRLWLRSWIAAVTVFLSAPLLVLFVFSFNDSKANVVWRGFTFKYYGKLFKNEGLMGALGNSLTIAFLATVVSLVLGALAAVMLWRFRFPAKAGVEGVMALPIVVPEICMAWRCWCFSRRSNGRLICLGRLTSARSRLRISLFVSRLSQWSFARGLPISTVRKRKPPRIWARANGRRSAMSCSPT